MPRIHSFSSSLCNFFPRCSHLPHAFSDISTCIPMLIAHAIYKAIHGNNLSVHQQRDGWRRYIYACSVTSVVSNSLRPYGLYSLPGSPVQRILQARILKWGAMSSSRASSWPRDQIHVSCIADGFFTAEPQGSLMWHIYNEYICTYITSLYIMEYYSAIKRMKYCHFQEHEWT